MFLYAHLNNGTYYGNTCSGRAASTGFPLSKSNSFHLVFIKLGEYVGGHNISTKFYNQPNPPGTPELWPFNFPKLGFPLSKSKSFRPVLIKLGEYVGGHSISTKFYSQPNPPRHSWIWPLNCPKTELAVSALQVDILLPIILSLPLNLTQIWRAHFVSVWHFCLVFAIC